MKVHRQTCGLRGMLDLPNSNPYYSVCTYVVFQAKDSID